MNKNRNIIMNLVPLLCYTVLFIIKMVLIFVYRQRLLASDFEYWEWISLITIIPIYYIIINHKNKTNKNYFKYCLMILLITVELFIIILPTGLTIDYIDEIGKSIIKLVWFISVIEVTIIWFTIRGICWLRNRKKS